jgi:PAS domain S-box-containing protein
MADAREPHPLSTRMMSESTGLAETLIESSMDCIKVLDLEGNLLSMSAGGQRLLEIRDITRYLNRSWIEFWAPVDHSRVRDAINDARQGSTGHFQAYCPSETGTPRWWDVLVSPISRGTNSPGQLLAVSRDITSQHQTEHMLQESRGQYQMLFHNMLNGFALCRIIHDGGRPVDFQYLDVNNAFETITGLKDVIGKRVTEILPDFRKTNGDLFEIYGRIADTGGAESVESYLPGLDLWLSIAIHSPAKGTFAAIFEDITERKREESILKARMSLMEYAGSHTLSDVLQKTLDEVIAITHSTVGFYHFVNPDQTTLSLQAWATRTPDESSSAKAIRSDYTIDAPGGWVDAIRQRRPVIHDDHPSSEHHKGLPERSRGELRELIVPIFRKDLIVAVLGVGNKALPYSDLDIQIVTYFGDIAWEIAERKTTEEVLARTEERFRTVAHSLSDIVYEWDLRDSVEWFGDVQMMRSQGADMFPGSRQEWIDRIHDDDRPIVQLAIERHLKGEISFNCEYRIRAGNGQWRYWTDRGTALRSDSLEPHRWVGSVSDISDQVNSRKDLAASEKRYHTLYDTMRDAFVSVNMAGKIIECNQAYLTLLGYTRQELEHKTYLDITPEQWHALESTIVDTQVLPRGYSDLYEKEYRGKSGRVIPVELRTILIRDDAGIPAGMWAIIRDISSRKEADELIRASQERFRSTFEQAAVGIAHVAPDGHWIRLNERFSEIVGYPMNELLVTTFQEITHPDDLNTDLELVRQMLANERDRYSLEKRYVRKDRTTVWVNLTVSLVRDPQGQPDYFIAVVEDISERKNLDADLRHLTAELEHRVEERTMQLETSNKELESFSYSVAHDLRAPLRGIDGWSQALLQEYAPSLDEKASEYLHRVRTESQRMGELIDDMLLLSRVARTDLIRRSVPFSVLAERVAQRVQQSYPDRAIGIEVHRNLTINADPHLLDIVLTNLIDNACKFTRERSPAAITIGTCERDGASYWFVRDNGVGFDMKYSRKLFTPFQRMHRQSDYPGTGIGLATVQRIISRHGGRVEIDSAKGHGTTVYFTM